MRIPTIRGIIDRRILVNFRVDPAVMQRHLPNPFRPKLVNGFAVGGICLIRLKQVRPSFIPIPLGLASENGAHRIAVEWDDGHVAREGVYIPRRDTNSRFSHIAGGRLFPGIHHHASFNVRESDDRYFVEFKSDDDETHVRVDGRVTNHWPEDSVFDSLDKASAFFETGALGYSATRNPGAFDGLELACDAWSCRAIDVTDVHSSYFEDESRFPKGSTQFDCALLMRQIHHKWHSRPRMRCGTCE